MRDSSDIVDAEELARGEVRHQEGVGAPVNMFRWMAPLFGRFGDRWDAAYIAGVAERLRPYLTGGGGLLDLGGGTGALAARLSDALEIDVTVLDPSPEMVAQMTPHARVTAVVGTAEDMPFPDASFDACIISDAFHHFRDQEAGVAEIRRVVRAGGGVQILEFEPKGWMLPIVWGERLLGEPAAFFTAEELEYYLAARGMPGRIERMTPTTYWFLGTVE
jgi:ubiquinone/menaquinone biosynthesis C-methylase UbiE